ncbi:hypothetical protein [Corallococcus sp. AB049A]|uniref:hypothetical protein n=1 Tax=Corallococcus sp. AB049A TaxID=2316721 RepID=UPI0011C440C0|nr:hypothetical protein [Corallococcus sp. AB049A]
MSDYVNQEEVDCKLGRKEVERLGDELDTGLNSLARPGFSQDDLKLAYLAVVESMAYSSGSDFDYNELVAPILDHVIARSPDDRSAGDGARAALKSIGTWAQAAFNYSSVVSYLINAALGRMVAAKSKTGRLLIFPSSPLVAEKRSRWLGVRWLAARRATQVDLAKEYMSEAFLWKMDDEVKKQKFEMALLYRLPRADWFENGCRTIASALLEKQFSHVGEREMWGGLTVRQTIDALLPLYGWAVKRALFHVRAHKYLTLVKGLSRPVMLSAVGVAPMNTLIREVSRAARLPMDMAAQFAESLVRRGAEERYGIQAYPLVPLRDGKVAFLPFSIIGSNLPLMREQATARGVVNPSAIGNARDRRHVERLIKTFQSVGGAFIASDVKIFGQDGNVLTDIDILVVEEGLGVVLAVQLKSFVLPTNLFDMKRAERDVGEAFLQCSVVESNHAAVQLAVESRFGVALNSGWTLRQIVVVEREGGFAGFDDRYPFVSLEWIENEGIPRTRDGSIEPLWNAAKELPDAADYMGGTYPLFQLWNGRQLGLRDDLKIATFSYLPG